MAKTKSDPENNRVLEALRKKSGAKERAVIDMRVTRLPDGEQVKLYRAVSKSDPNGRQYLVGFDADGEELDGEKLSAARAALEPHVSSGPAGTAPAAPAITINPKENVFTLAEGETIQEAIIVNIPADAGVKKADIYFLGSIGPGTDPALRAFIERSENRTASRGISRCHSHETSRDQTALFIERRFAGPRHRSGRAIEES